MSDAVGVELAAQLLARGQPVELFVGGSSMWPLVRDGDRLRIVPGRAVRVGALVAVFARGHLVVHRIVARTADGYVLKGDNDGPPEPIRACDVLGVVTRHWVAAGREVPLAAGWAVAQLSRRTGLPWRLLRRVRDAVRR